MTLNHLNLTVTNPEETSAFLAKYFELRQGGGNKGMQLLRDDCGMVLTLFKARAEDRAPAAAASREPLDDGEAQPRPGAPDGVRYPSSFHIGFLQESQARVREIHARLRQDGYPAPEPSEQHGSWGFYLFAPGGFMVEVTA